MAYTETFLCTALPEGITGTKVRIAVLVSPRLSGSGGAGTNLDNWPDVRDWPAIAPTWQVTIEQDGTEVTLPGTEVVAQPYDKASWDALFPPSMPVRPYEPVDRAQAPIYSYPVAKVLAAVRALHTKVLTGSRTQFPTLASLQDDSTFRALKQACDPSFAGELRGSLADGPRADSTFGLAEVFAMSGDFHGIRPGSAPPPPPPTPTTVSMTPRFGLPGGGTLVTITGTNFIEPVTVKFGPDSATGVDVDSATSLTCLSPGGPELEFDVIVTTPYGSSPRNDDVTFRYDDGIN